MRYSTRAAQYRTSRRIGETEVGEYQQSLRELASDEIDTLLKSAGLNSARVSVFSQENSPFRAIEQVASRIGADLAVVGTSRFPLFKRVFIGSVSNEVLRGIEHDVLVISPWPPGVLIGKPGSPAGVGCWVRHQRVSGTYRMLEARDAT